MFIQWSFFNYVPVVILWSSIIYSKIINVFLTCLFNCIIFFYFAGLFLFRGVGYDGDCLILSNTLTWINCIYVPPHWVYKSILPYSLQLQGKLIGRDFCLSFSSDNLRVNDMIFLIYYLMIFIIRGRAGYELIYITNEAVGYYQLISGKSEKNNCFSKFLRVKPPQILTFSLPTTPRKMFFRPPKFQHKKFAISFSLCGQT